MPYIVIIVALLLIPLTLIANTEMGKVAYLVFTDGYWQVWTMLPDGSDQRQITTTDYDKSHISWYADGVHILANANNGELYKINTATNESTKLSLPISGAIDAVVSLKDNRIVFSLSVGGSRDNNHLWVTDSQGKKLTKLTNMNGLQHEPVWSEDGEWIYFLSRGGADEHNIWRISVKNKNIEQLSAGQLFHFDIAVGSGSKIAFSNNRTGNYEIWTKVNGEDEKITNHPALDARPSLAANGNQLLFESTRSGVINIWRTTIDGKSPKQITRHAKGARFPVWWQLNKSDNR